MITVPFAQIFSIHDAKIGDGAPVVRHQSHPSGASVRIDNEGQTNESFESSKELNLVFEHT
jgi:hypothetical protein